jgi:hypothetical protein
LGLVDYLGDMATAAKLAGKLAGKEGKYDLVYPTKKRISIFDFLVDEASSKISSSLKDKLEGKSGLSYLYYPGR